RKLFGSATFHLSRRALALYNGATLSHIPDPYVAVDFDPDLAHHPGDRLRPADLGDPHAAAAQRRIRGSFRLWDDREYLRSADHDSPDQGHGLPRWNILWGYPPSHDFDRSAELGTKDWSPRKRAKKYKTSSQRDGGAKSERDPEPNNQFTE